MKSLLLILAAAAALSAQVPLPSPLVNTPPDAMNAGQQPITGKWTVANSGSNLVVTNPDGSTSTVAKAAALTQSVTVFTLPTNAVVQSCVVKTDVAFVGTATLTATVGVTSAVTGCISGAYDLKAAVSATNVSAGLPSPSLVRISGTDLILALTATTNNISAISTGTVSVWLTWYRLP